MTTDFFKDIRTGIFQERASIPEEAGWVSLPFSNVGSMESSGIDGNVSFNHSFGKDLHLTLRGNYTITRNEITNWEQANIRYPYQANTGYPYGVLRGLIALGLFEDEEDVASSPRQTFEKEVLPGDIKYKDVNGDGLINDDDVVPLSYANTPLIQYGFAAELRYKNWTFSAFLREQAKRTSSMVGLVFIRLSAERQVMYCQLWPIRRTAGPARKFRVQKKQRIRMPASRVCLMAIMPTITGLLLSGWPMQVICV